MAVSRVEPGFDQDRSFFDRNPALGIEPDLSRALVVGNSQINRIVVSKIVERAGLRPITETPLTAVRVLPLLFPAIVVLDGGADSTDCEAVMPAILALRRISGRSIPAVILLSNRNGSPESFAPAGAIDAVVAKPFTTDQLQPVVERLIGRARG